MKIDELIKELRKELSANPNDDVRMDYFDMVCDGEQWHYINKPQPLPGFSMPVSRTGTYAEFREANTK